MYGWDAYKVNPLHSRVKLGTRRMQEINSQPGALEKVRFLSQPISYPENSVDNFMRVEVIKTHMSWVFLTKQYAYKLKKPVRYRFLDFSTLAARHQDCQAELQLNQRLAPQVYLEVVPLVVKPQGQLQLGGSGNVVDWLVKMRRLPAKDMLDVAIQRGTVEEADFDWIVQHLVNFYQTLSPVNLPNDYLGRLKLDLQTTLQDLRLHGNGLSSNLISQLLAFLEAESEIFSDRIR